MATKRDSSVARLKRFGNFLQNRTALLALAGVVLASALSAQEGNRKWQSSDAMKKLGGYRPQRLRLGETRPEAVKKLPADLSAPLYGTLKLGPKDAAQRFLAVLAE